jgi:hypothetical protein
VNSGVSFWNGILDRSVLTAYLSFKLTTSWSWILRICSVSLSIEVWMFYSTFSYSSSIDLKCRFVRSGVRPEMSPIISILSTVKLRDSLIGPSRSVECYLLVYFCMKLFGRFNFTGGLFFLSAFAF